MTWNKLRRYLGKVEKPARYTGGEINSVQKDPQSVDVLFALAFPDVYEVGMSHLGSQILYAVLNGRDDVSCERVYAPWHDMESLLKEKGWPLFSIENRLPLSSFDIVGFSLQYELAYTNVLMMLDLGGIPLRSKHRGPRDPLVIAGGPCAMAAEPIADFIDAFALGDGEELSLEIVDTYKAWKATGRSRLDLLVMLSLVEGVYVPSLYDVKYNCDGTVAGVSPVPVRLGDESYKSIKAQTGDLSLQSACFPEDKPGYFVSPSSVKRRVIKSLEDAAFIDKPLVPLIEPIHDRVMVEIFRGCTQGCRFCQAGTIYRPVRERTPETITAYARKLLEASGYGEVSLVSLSSADYSHIEELLSRLMTGCPGSRVSLPSLRVDSFSVELAKMLGASRTGLTLAPEAGSQRMRDIINKKVTEEDILSAAGNAFSSGFAHIKLYFMIGLPGEADEDVTAIADLAKKIRQIGRDMGIRPTIVVSVSGFVPKPNTPFQWEPCIQPEELRRRQKLLRDGLRGPGLNYKYHDVEHTWLEAVLARGDRKLAGALELAYERGARFDAWSNHLDIDIWEQVFHDTGLDPAFYAHRKRDAEETLPWDHLDFGVSKQFLLREREKARNGIITSDCRAGHCTGCGVCLNLGVEMSLK
ncbi:MAG TPA: TIGR03960 family B12-binding radical SAM protein [Firmicutes bacterium]|nr:TIGR03960 family B12-binding radical SAM protein [Candidatus Fermentithermobacillaceae bacterium]